MKKFFDAKKPVFIAEISCNHNGKLANAKKLISLAKKCGADLVKLQTYTPDTMTIDVKINFSKSKMDYGRVKIYGLYILNLKHLLVGRKLCLTTLSWHHVFTTPFDESAVDLLESLKCPFYKISSFEMTDVD